MLPRRPYTERKAPDPSDDHAQIEQWIGRAMPELQPMLTSIDQEIRKASPDAYYAIKWGKAHYGTPECGWIIEMVAYDVSANLVFFGGEDFDPPPPLGDTDRSRYIKLYSLDEAEAPEVLDWIEQATRVPGWQ